LTVGSQPRFDTISKVIHALGLKISVHVWPLLTWYTCL
jgi:DNA-binding phage protein